MRIMKSDNCCFNPHGDPCDYVFPAVINLILWVLASAAFLASNHYPALYGAIPFAVSFAIFMCLYGTRECAHADEKQRAKEAAETKRSQQERMLQEKENAAA